MFGGACLLLSQSYFMQAPSTASCSVILLHKNTHTVVAQTSPVSDRTRATSHAGFWQLTRVFGRSRTTQVCRTFLSINGTNFGKPRRVYKDALFTSCAPMISRTCHKKIELQTHKWCGTDTLKAASAKIRHKSCKCVLPWQEIGVQAHQIGEPTPARLYPVAGLKRASEKWSPSVLNLPSSQK